MKVKTLDGQEYDWKIPEKIAKGNKRKTSKLHQEAKQRLHRRYLNTQIYEEVPIKVTVGKTLYLDFYIPLFQVAVEVNGPQHYSYSTLFHKNQMEFLKAKTKDAEKQVWCEINDIELVTLKYNEIDDWNDQI